VLPEEGPIIIDIPEDEDHTSPVEPLVQPKTRQRRARKAEVEPQVEAEPEQVAPSPIEEEDAPVDTGFDYYLVDEFGEILGGAKYGDPAAFIEDFLEYSRGLDDGLVNQFQDANTKALHAAMRDPEAAKLMRGDTKTPAEEPEPAQTVSAEPPKPGTPEHDEMVADGFISDLNSLSIDADGRRAFNNWVSDPRVRQTMGGWRKTNKAMFDRVDLLAKKKNEQLPR